MKLKSGLIILFLIGVLLFFPCALLYGSGGSDQRSSQSDNLRNLISFEIYTDTWNLAAYEPLEKT